MAETGVKPWLSHFGRHKVSLSPPSASLEGPPSLLSFSSLLPLSPLQTLATQTLFYFLPARFPISLQPQSGKFSPSVPPFSLLNPNLQSLQQHLPLPKGFLTQSALAQLRSLSVVSPARVRLCSELFRFPCHGPYQLSFNEELPMQTQAHCPW